MRKRTWHYVMKPSRYGILCDICNGSNIEWSEFEHKIWCYDCEIDTDGFPGIFGGAIGLGISQVLGLSFDKWNMKKQRIEYFRITKDNKIKWFVKPNKKDEI